MGWATSYSLSLVYDIVVEMTIDHSINLLGIFNTLFKHVLVIISSTIVTSFIIFSLSAFALFGVKTIDKNRINLRASGSVPGTETVSLWLAMTRRARTSGPWRVRVRHFFSFSYFLLLSFIFLPFTVDSPVSHPTGPLRPF